MGFRELGELVFAPVAVLERVGAGEHADGGEIDEEAKDENGDQSADDDPEGPVAALGGSMHGGLAFHGGRPR